jgi:hypothetical protein
MWSKPHIMSMVQFLLNDAVNEETGVSPFEFVFGSRDKKFFILHEALDSTCTSKFMEALNGNLRDIRHEAEKVQGARQDSRKTEGAGANSYQVGDLVLRKLEKMVNKATKLTPNYLGPYLVVAVDKADATCRHLVTDVVSVFHMTELKMCFASRREAYEAALVDFHQYVIDRILKYKGDPELRTSMVFLVRFADGSEVWLPFSRDLSESAQFEDFVRAHRPLMPLLYTVEAWKRIRRETFREVEGVKIGDIFELGGLVSSSA